MRKKRNKKTRLRIKGLKAIMEINTKKITLIVGGMVIVFGAIGWLGYSYFVKNKTEDLNTQLPGKREPGAEQSQTKQTRKFSLSPVGDSGVKGDGSSTLNAELTSFGMRLITAPELKSGEVYESYIILKEGTDPQLIGTFIKVKSANEKFIAGGTGATSWYEGAKIIIAKRGSKEEKPGTVVAEGSLNK